MVIGGSARGKSPVTASPGYLEVRVCSLVHVIPVGLLRSDNRTAVSLDVKNPDSQPLSFSLLLLVPL